MERERISRVLRQDLLEMMNNPNAECRELAKEACVTLLMKDTVGERRKRFFCTRCGNDFIIDFEKTLNDDDADVTYNAKHQGNGICARCGADGAVIEGKRWNLDRHGWYAPLIVRVQLEGDWQAILCFEVKRKIYYSEAYGFSQDLRLGREDVYLMGRGAAAHYKYSWHHQGFLLHRKIDADGCDIRGGFGGPLSMHTQSTGVMQYVLYDIGEWDTERDILKYMPPQMCGGYDPCVAACTFAAYPQTEMLWKAGFQDIVKTFMLDGKKCAAICRLDGGNVREIFHKFSKAELRWLIENKMAEVGYMEHYVKLKRIYGSRIALAQEALMVLEAAYWDRSEVLRVSARVGVEPHILFRYIDKLVAAGKAKKKPQPWETGRSAVYTHWKDYVEAALAVGLDISREDVLFPKKLGERHDMAVKLHRDILAQQAAKDMEEVFWENEERYGFSDGEFIIVNPRSSYDIIDEGKAQCHCVAGYADRHAKGLLAIVFIRRVGEEDKALITVEMREDKMIQARKKHNRAPDAHEKEFIDKWLLEVCERFHPTKKNKRKELTAEAVGARV